VGPPEIVQGAGYGLNLIVRRGAALRLDFLYRTDSIGEASVARLAAQLERLLVEMAAGRHTRLDDLSALPEEERREVTVAWNATDAPYPQDACLHELFDAQARRTPDALAVADGRRRLTYGELDRRAGNLARRLRARGVGPEVIVGLALERSADLVAGMLGIAKAGSAFLLLDPRNPPDRTAFMLADSGARLVVTRGPRPASLPEHVEAVPVDADGDGAGEALEGVPLTPSSLAYVVYTSGTTGTPRGVMVEARGLMNLIAWHARAFGISPQDRATQIAGPGFDAAVWEIWPYLASGSSIHIPPEEVRGMPARLRDWLLGESITITFLPTPLAEAMLSLDWPPAAPLRTVLVGGDVLHASPRPGLPFAVVNNYGPSECTVVATSGTALPGGGPPSIGRPIANTQVYLLDERRRPVPVGVTAEISIGGAGVARGYLNRPDLTAERFLPHPFTPGERIYRTGDLARHRPNGELEFVGRADRQITLRGYRIEPDEIEAALRRQPGVREAAAVVRDGEQGERLVAYVVPTAEGDIDVPALRRALRATLPDYMVPAAFVPLASLPLTPNGKIDRAALPAPRWMGMEAGGRRTAPHSATERALASLWSDVLGVESVGVHDSFFDLGGDSLLSIRLVEGIRARLGVDLGVSDLFRAPTPAGLAGVIERPVLPAPVDTLVPIRPLGSRLPFFCAAPVLGTVFPYYELAHLLPDDQPFYGLQPAGLSPGEAFTVEALAGRYIEAVCAVQARGPYRLGGWSFGGLVAFEMAQQLRRAGHEVALLAVLDTPAPAPHRGNQLGRAFAFLASTVTRGLWGYAQDYGYLAVIAAPRPASCVRPLLQTARRPLARRASIAEVVARESRLARYRLPTIREMARSFGGGLLAALRYRPEGYAGEITLIRTGEPALDGEDGGSFGWDELAPGGVRLYRVPGNHMTLLRYPHLPAVAAALREALDRAG
jgi:amino acid adenylation domain-containing protein